MEEDPKEKRSSLGNWLSAIFFLLVFVAQPLLNLIRRATSGMSLPSGISLPMLLGGVALVAFVIGTVVVLGGRARRSGDTRLPTSLPQQPSSSSRYDDYDYDFEPIYPNTMPNTMGEIPTLYPTRSLPSEAAIPDYTPQLPKPPSFEPLINGRVLMALLGLFVLFGAAYFAAQFIFSILS